MKKAAVVGIYGVGSDFTTGQAVKCYEVINWLKKKYGKNDIDVVNTYKWNKTPLKLFVNLLNAFFRCNNVIIMPAQHGIKVFAPLIYYFNKVFQRKVHYVVIGGWLPEMLSEKPRMKKYIYSFDAVHVETKEMVSKLQNIGISQIYHMPNFRILPIMPIKRTQQWIEPLPVCTYSRVVKEKGILDAIEIVKEANRQSKKNLFYLDIYGKIDPEFKTEFEKSVSQNTNIINYCGVKNADDGPATLSNYFALLFPTYYEGEGFAGTILDAFVSQTPMIVNDWKYNKEIIRHGENGLIYPYRDIRVAAKYLYELYVNNKLYEEIQYECKNEAKRYSTDSILEEFNKTLI
ncbi:MAG: glycosyltransferase [Erysipelotrichaceae bacterium]|nr:glycosyltransferase [Erysipelotrichaceae bacterium]